MKGASMQKEGVGEGVEGGRGKGVEARSERKHKPNIKLAMDAVNTELVHRSRPWCTSNFPSGIHPKTMAATDAKTPTIIA